MDLEKRDFLLAGAGVMAAAASAGTPGSFPLAAKAGVDSHADKIAPLGAANQDPFNMSTWMYGHRFDALPKTPIWHPAKENMMRGEQITSVTIDGNADPGVYCAAANSGVDFIWTEMQHSGGTWGSVQEIWTTAPIPRPFPASGLPTRTSLTSNTRWI